MAESFILGLIAVVYEYGGLEMHNDSDMPVHVRCKASLTALRCNIISSTFLEELRQINPTTIISTTGHQSDLLTLVTLVTLVSVGTNLRVSPEGS